MFNPRQYGIARASSTIHATHAEDLQPNESAKPRRRSAQPPKIASSTHIRVQKARHIGMPSYRTRDRPSTDGTVSNTSYRGMRGAQQPSPAGSLAPRSGNPSHMTSVPRHDPYPLPNEPSFSQPRPLNPYSSQRQRTDGSTLLPEFLQPTLSLSSPRPEVNSTNSTTSQVLNPRSHSRPEPPVSRATTSLQSPSPALITIKKEELNSHSVPPHPLPKPSIKAEDVPLSISYPAVKQEPSEDIGPIVPQRRLVTQSCSFFPIPENCRKSCPGYRDNRISFFQKEYARLRSFGLKKQRVVFRGDGMAIEWTSPIPVWSDTLLPE